MTGEKVTWVVDPHLYSCELIRDLDQTFLINVPFFIDIAIIFICIGVEMVIKIYIFILKRFRIIFYFILS